MKYCKMCGKEHDVTHEFCSWECEQQHLKSLKKKLDDAIRDDKGHTQKLSRT